jgi:hypothetical protein
MREDHDIPCLILCGCVYYIICNDVMWTIYVLVLMSMVWCWYDDDDDDHE